MRSLAHWHQSGICLYFTPKTPLDDVTLSAIVGDLFIHYRDDVAVGFSKDDSSQLDRLISIHHEDIYQAAAFLIREAAKCSASITILTDSRALKDSLQDLSLEELFSGQTTALLGRQSKSLSLQPLSCWHEDLVQNCI